MEIFELIPELSFSGVVLLPVLYWFFSLRLTPKLIKYGAFIIYVFSFGVIQNLGFPQTIIKISTEIIIVLFFITNLGNISKRFNRNKIPFLWVLLIVFSAIISNIFSETNFVLTIFFLRDNLITILLFYVFFYNNLTDYEIEKISKLTIFLFSVQPIASIIKIIYTGAPMENYIGTMSIGNGSLTTIIFLLAYSWCFINYLIKQESKYLIYIILFFVFALSGGKRAIMFMAPTISFFIYVLYTYKSKSKLSSNFFKNSFLIIIISCSIVYLSIRLLPSLNPEKKVWGTFDISYALEYSQDYNTIGVAADTEIVGRGVAIPYVSKILFNDGLSNLLLGNGAGHLIKSKYNNYFSRYNKNEKLTDLSYRLYGIGYSVRSSFTLLLLQVGLLGALIFIFFYISIFKNILKSIKSSENRLSNYILHYLFICALFLIFTFDFLFYSSTTIQISSASIFFHICLALYLRNKQQHFFTNS